MTREEFNIVEKWYGNGGGSNDWATSKIEDLKKLIIVNDIAFPPLDEVMNNAELVENLAKEYQSIAIQMRGEEEWETRDETMSFSVEVFRRLLLAHPEITRPSLPSDEEMETHIRDLIYSGITNTDTAESIVSYIHSLLSPSDPRPESGETKP